MKIIKFILFNRFNLKFNLLFSSSSIFNYSRKSGQSHILHLSCVQPQKSIACRKGVSLFLDVLDDVTGMYTMS